jgi:P-type Ca2+ transporter type 2C
VPLLRLRFGLVTLDSLRKLSVSFKNLLIQSIAINSTAFEGEENGQRAFIGSKTETALLSLAKDHLSMCAVAEKRADTETVQLIPFDSSRKCMGAVIRLSSGDYRLVVKGAAELMLRRRRRHSFGSTFNVLSQLNLSTP